MRSNWWLPVAALAALLLLAGSFTGYLQARAAHKRSLHVQAQLLQNTLKGAGQNLEQVAAPNSSGEGVVGYLVQAEASLAQAEILLLSYQQATGVSVPLRNVPSLYARRVQSVRAEATRTGHLTDQHEHLLAEIRSDLQMLEKAIDPEALAGTGRAKAAASLANVAPNLKLPEAKTVLTPSPGK